MKRYFTIYKEQMLTGLKTAMAYRTDFVLSSLITVVSNVLFPLVTVMIYATGAKHIQYGNWSMRPAVYNDSLGYDVKCAEWNLGCYSAKAYVLSGSFSLQSIQHGGHFCYCGFCSDVWTVGQSY